MNHILRSVDEIIRERDEGYVAGCITDLDFKLYEMNKEDESEVYFEQSKNWLVDFHFERGKKYSVISKTTSAMKSSFIHDLITKLCIGGKFIQCNTNLENPIIYYHQSHADRQMVQRKLYNAKQAGNKIGGKICFVKFVEDVVPAILQVKPDLVIVDGYTYMFNKSIFDNVDLSDTVLIVTGSFYDDKMKDHWFDYILDFARYNKKKDNSLAGSAISRIGISFYNTVKRMYEYTYSFKAIVENDSIYLKLVPIESYDMLKYIIKHYEVIDEPYDEEY